MNRFYLPLLLLLLLAAEGVALDLLPTTLDAYEWMIVPHWVLVFLVMVAVLYDQEYTYISILYAIVFGLLFDIVYTDVLGVYMFTYAIVIYAIHGLNKLLHTSFIIAILFTTIAIALADFGVYFIYLTIGINSIDWQTYAVVRLLPTLTANLVFFVCLYPMLKGKLIKWSAERFDTKKLS
ncbi:rod shape-determining protein MreD [Radiobacillus sp. PE A8.2]|uniref:rod shape-determining protein MreD n=1 Tax=Radiobacillus sp. PE A8.2 TaxID=3380349 RepID=UPI00388F76DE